MSFKSIIDIDVNDAQFKEFYKLFQDYKDRVGEIPQAWKDIEAQTKRAAKAQKELSGKSWSPQQFRKVREEMKKTADEQKRFHAYSLRTAIQMDKMAKSAKGIAHSFLGIGKTMAHMAGWGLGLGAAGLFGLGELGNMAVSRQKSAAGVGVNQGNIQAWKTYMQQYVDSGMIGKVANAQTSIKGQWQLHYMTGLPMGQIRSMSPDELAFQVSMSERQYWKTAPKGMQTMLPKWTAGFSQFSTPEEARELASHHRSTLAGAWAKDQAAAKAWHIGRGSVSEWRQFTQSLSAAGHELETVLTNRLAALAPYMKTFVDSITKDAKAFIESTLTPANVKAFGEGMKAVATYLGSPAFLHGVKQAGQALDDVVHAILWAAKKLHWMTSQDQVPNKAGRTSSGLINGKTNLPPYTHILQSEAVKKYYLSQLEQKYKLPAGSLWGVYGAESSYGKNTGPSSAGALGPFQIMPENFRKLGIKNPQSFMQEAKGAAIILAQNQAMYRGDIRKSLAAYNSSPSTVNRAISSKGTHWMEAVPAETRSYVPKVMLVIDNRAGANVHVSANAAGQ